MAKKTEIKEKKAKSPKKKRITDDFFVMRLCNRSTIFFIFQVIVAFALYVSGSLSGFSDVVLHFLLLWCSVTSILLIMFCIAGLVICLISIIVKRRAHLILRVLFYLLVLILTPVIFAFVSAVRLISAGLGSG